MVSQTQYFLWMEKTNISLILFPAVFGNELISNLFNLAGDHNHDNQPQHNSNP